LRDNLCRNSCIGHEKDTGLGGHQEFSNNKQNVLEAVFFFWGISAKSNMILKKRTVRKLDSVLVSFDIKSLARRHQISGFIWLPHVTYIKLSW